MRDALDLSDLLGGSSDDTSDIDATHSSEDTFIYGRGVFPTKFILVVTGAYNEQVRRSFSTNVSGEDEDALTQLLDDSHGRADFVGMARLANDIIRPDTAIDKHLSIVNGWDEPRIRFYLELCRDFGNGSKITYAYTGFTDYVGVTEQGHIDEQMKFHVTSCTIIQRNEGVSSRIHSDKSYYVNEIHYSGSYRPNSVYTNNYEYLMDPANAIYMYEARTNHMGEDLNGAPLIPGHSKIGLSAKLIDRSYNIPSHYLSKLLNTKRQVLEDDHLYSSDDGMDSHASILQRHRTLLGGSGRPDMMADPLASIYREDGFSDTATVTYGSLVEYLPSIDSRRITSIVFPAGMRQSGARSFEARVRDAGQYGLEADDWDGAGIETLVATSICQQLPNLMMSELIGSVRFTVTNEIVGSTILDGSRYEWIYGNDRRDVRDAIWFMLDLPWDIQHNKRQNFETKVEGIILDSVTKNGLIDINLTVDCDVKAECIVCISIGGGQEYKFIMPCFADSMSSPLITTDVGHYTQVVNDVVGLVDNAFDNLRQSRHPRR